MPIEIKTPIANGERRTITKAQQNKIKKAYSDLAKTAENRSRFLKGRDNISSILRAQYLDDLKEELIKNVEKINKQLEKDLKSGMLKMAETVVDENNVIASKMGLGIEGAYSYVPNDVVEDIISGKLYKGKWTLSKAIWSDNKRTISDIEEIIAKGVAANKSSYDIAKDLEVYVDPNVRKSAVYPGTKKVVDYNAFRLVKTMIGHAKQESFVRATKKNPFFESYKWLTSNSDRVCPICLGRANNDSYGLGAGIFPKDRLPLDHPNGMCTFSVSMSKSYEQIANDLVGYVNGTGDPILNKQLDEFVSDLYGKKVIKNVAVNKAKEKIVSNLNVVQKIKPIKRQAEYLDELADMNMVTLSNDNSDFVKLAKQWNVTPDDANSIFTKKMFSLIDKNDIGMRRTASDLKKILKDGSFKNQFQTGSSDGLLDTSARELIEEKMMAVPATLPIEQKPVYGMLFDTTNESKNKIVKYFRDGPGDFYGDVNVIFKKDMIKQNLSFTIDDSLEAFYDDEKNIAFDINTEKIGKVPYRIFRKINDMSVDKFENANVSDIFDYHYLETQIHGIDSKKIDCIEKIVFTSQPDSDMINLLDNAKIAFEVLE